MLHLVTGGSGSGKSAYAEDIACSGKERLYIATMIPYGEETQKKIQRHRDMRANKGFSTVECYTDLRRMAEEAKLCYPEFVVSKSSHVLLECMSNLVANEMYQPGGAGEFTADAVIQGIRILQDRCGCLVIVTNEVFGECAEDSCEMQRYKRTLAEVNVRLGNMADTVTEVVCGIPVPVKGTVGEECVKEKGASGMKLIIGGAYQGKRAYAEKAYGIKNWVDGSVCSFEEVFSCGGIYAFEMLLRRMLEEGRDISGLSKEIVRRNPEVVIVSTEIGCGLVPVDAFLREYREQAGRICTELGALASRVDRVVCGTAVTIKGGAV